MKNLGVAQVTSGPWTDGLRRFLAHPGAMVGTDSTFLGDKPSPRTYGSYPRILGQRAARPPQPTPAEVRGILAREPCRLVDGALDGEGGARVRAA